MNTLDASALLTTMGKSAPNFFGLTSLGTSHLAQAKPAPLPFHHFSPEEFADCFADFRNEELELALLVRARRNDCFFLKPAVRSLYFQNQEQRLHD